MSTGLKIIPNDQEQSGDPIAFLKCLLRRPSFLAVGLAVITAWVYLPVRSNGFVNYDDPDYVTSNPHVQSGISWENLKWAFTTGHASNWHPLTWVSHMLDWQMFGAHAAPQHLVSLGFHAANTLLLFFLLLKITGGLWRSAMVAVLFALHPAHVESVAWISERKDVLSAFFWMLTLITYAEYAIKRSSRTLETAHRNYSAGQGLPPLLYYGLSLVLFMLGLMSKPMVVTLPFVLLLLDYWPFARVLEYGGKFKRMTVFSLIIEKTPFFILSALSSYITFVVQRKGGAVSTSISLAGRIANAAISYVRYIGEMLWPHHLSVLYPHPGHWPLTQIIIAVALLLFISALVVMLMRKRPYLAVGWFWFLGTLVPVIGLIQVGVQSMADRYTYIPFIGLFISVVWGAADVFTEIYKAQPMAGLISKAASIFAGLILLICASLTSNQIRYWRNSETLFQHAVSVTKGNYLAYNNLGFYLSHDGKPLEAMENYRKSLEINPNYEDALNNMGYALAGLKKPVEAIPYYLAALRIRPKHTEVHNNLGNAFADLGQIDKAMEQYRMVLSEQPDHVDAHNNLGIALAMKGQLDVAIGHFHEAIKNRPGDAGAHSNLGNAFAAQQKFKEAMQEYEACLRLKPDDAQAHNNLANVLAEEGLVKESIIHYERALQLNADNPEAHFNLAMALSRLARKPEAIAHIQAALRLKPDYEQAKSQLQKLKANQVP
jgi:tetratricopeptide (TPR) repeat protein